MNSEIIKVRQAIGGRGGYLLYIYRQMKAENVSDTKGILCRAISKWGRSKIKDRTFSEASQFVSCLEKGNHQAVYERNIVESGRDRSVVKMSHCPLLKCWQDEGATEDEIKDLCDIASEGDYSSTGDTLRLTFDQRLADGDECCLMKVERV